MPAGQMPNLLLINVDGNPTVFQDPERGIMNVIAVEVGDDHSVNCGEEFPQGFPAGSHRGESGINEQGGFTRFQEQRVSRTAAAQGLKGKEQYEPLGLGGIAIESPPQFFMSLSSIGRRRLHVK
jgi:hypothetical protein